MNIVVQKFGGTSVATPSARDQAVKRIVQAKKAGQSPVVVISAIGRKGDPYATDTLLELINEVGPSVPKRERDLLLSCGETISCALVSTLLANAGYRARALTGGQAGIITDAEFGNALIIEVLPEPLKTIVKEGIIPIVAGFQGRTPNGDITTLGRGGSDTTAAAVAAALDAEAIEIFSDVEGVMTADPHLVGEAHTLDVVTYDEVTQLAYQGAKIIHPRALELAKQYNIPIKVRSTFSDGPGTLVTRGVYCPGKLQLMPDRLIAGIAHLPNIVQIRVEMPAADKKRETELFEILAKAGVSIDLINVFPRAKIFTITKNDLFAAQQALSEAKFEASITRELAKVSVVGAGMRGVPGVMATVVKVLNSAQVEILQTADSHATISCLVRGVDTQKALCALHEGFGLGKQ